jgi:alpha-tubulin suppressor-like RCC1 family protein
MVVAKEVNYRSIAAGASFTCAIDADSVAFCWGQNVSGELGNGTVGEDSPAPTAVAGNLSFAQLSGGVYHTCGLTGAGAAYCWGLNATGELGTGDTASIESTPVAVAGGLAYTSIAAGGLSTCALATSGVAYCWGNAISPTPTPAGGSLTFSSITVGDETICAIGTDGVAYCWGANVGGEVGDGTFAPRTAPTRVLGQP